MPETTIGGAASASQLKAYLAVPPVGTGPWPGVVVVHEAFGLTDDTRQQADRLAAGGYLALAPDLFSAGGAVRCLRSTFRTLARGEGPAFDDLAAARSWLTGRSDCTGSVGILGFCMGGGFALLAATRGFDASAPNYGQIPSDLDARAAGRVPRGGQLRGSRQDPARCGRAIGRGLDRPRGRPRRQGVPTGRPLLHEPAQRRATRRPRAGGRLRLPPSIRGGRLAADPRLLLPPPPRRGPCCRLNLQSARRAAGRPAARGPTGAGGRGGVEAARRRRWPR
ncbi:dienelactone hydrolase family protein [Blastococcus sp. TML/C7B]|nr:dienelactone hydrolase family protein [Blastococcus sp. TML/C7B]